MSTSLGITNEQKARLQEVADLMLGIYETLVAMRYVDAKAIVRGPHQINKELQAEYKKHHLDDSIIYLYSILPYIDQAETDARDFFQGGAFFNHMDPRDIERGRDPCYASPRGGYESEDGEYMYPWYTPLSNCGNHSPIMIYDAKEHRMWIIEQIDRCSTDPFFAKGWYADVEEERREESNWGDSGESSWSEDEDSEEGEDDGGSDGSSDYWEDEDEQDLGQELDGLRADQAEDVPWDEGFDVVEEPSEWERFEQSKNRNDLECARHRDASAVLRDINRWYRELKELPGQGEYTHWLEPKMLRPIYKKNGWPETFDGEHFEVDMARQYCAKRAKYFAEEPLRKVECYEGWKKYSDYDIERYGAQVKEAQNIKDVNAEWIARFELMQTQERSARNSRDLAEAKATAERLCQDGQCQREEDLALWELERVKLELRDKHREVSSTTEWADREKDPERKRHFQGQRRRALHKVKIYERALKEAEEDARRLCPDRTLHEDGLKALRPQTTQELIQIDEGLIEPTLDRLQALRSFLTTVPKEASSAIAHVKAAIDREEASLESVRTRLARSRKWLAEHGDDN